MDSVLPQRRSARPCLSSGPAGKSPPKTGARSNPAWRFPAERERWRNRPPKSDLWSAGSRTTAKRQRAHVGNKSDWNRHQADHGHHNRHGHKEQVAQRYFEGALQPRLLLNVGCHVDFHRWFELVSFHPEPAANPVRSPPAAQSISDSPGTVRAAQAPTFLNGSYRNISCNFFIFPAGCGATAARCR